MLLAVLLAPALARAQRDTTREAMVRMEEVLAGRQEDGVGLVVKDLVPAIVVSVTPAYEETRKWYPTAALTTLSHLLGGNAGLRACEACMAPRTQVEQGHIALTSGSPNIQEIIALDAAGRGKGSPARTAVWLDETESGVSLRIVDLRNSRIVIAENFDAQLAETTHTYRNLAMSRELERRGRGDSLTHIFFDAAVLPSQHVSIDFDEQWGETNANLSGLTLSLFDPIVGIGGSYYRIIPQALNIMVGVQVLVSVPTAIINAVGGNMGTTNTAIFDHLVTGVLVVRLPFSSSNYGLVATLSTNGRFGVGISLLNISFLPFLP